jgi:hypothetical protein
MEEIKIFYKPEVENYINDLVFILYKEEYFGFLQSSLDYKDKIIDFIEENISTIPSKNTPIPLISLGSKYITYKANQRTSWYIFFENEDDVYLITYITNSHSKIFQYL